MSDMNFLKVTTRVTVREAHSVVKMNTDRIHMYLEINVKVIKQIIIITRYSKTCDEGNLSKCPYMTGVPS